MHWDEPPRTPTGRVRKALHEHNRSPSEVRLSQQISAHTAHGTGRTTMIMGCQRRTPTTWYRQCMPRCPTALQT